jgi:hypothetical protein
VGEGPLVASPPVPDPPGLGQETPDR